MNFIRLFQRVILRHFRYERGKLFLSVTGVAIGVAVFVAIRLANTAAYQAFSSTLDAVAGRANLQVLSNDGLGFDERLIGKLRQSRAVLAAAPVVEQYALLPDSSAQPTTATGAPVLVFGIDVFAESAFRDYSFSDSSITGESGLRFLLEPGAIIITEKIAAQAQVRIGDTLRLVANSATLPFHVVSIVAAEGTASALGGNFALLDIASAQEAFGRLGKLDRIDLLVPDDQRADIRNYLSETLPPGITITEPASRGAQTTRMLDSFDLNLSALAFIALFVAMFIIYNTMLTNTLRRRRELGILRAVGATRRMIVGLFLTEATLIGLMGVLVGLPLGIVLAQLAVDQVTQTVTALYILTVTEHLAIDPVVLAIGGLLGIGASIFSALPAAMEASRAHPRETFSVQTVETKVSLNYTRIIVACVVFLVSAVAAGIASQQLISPLLGFISAALVLLGFAAITPLFIKTSDALFGGIIKRLFGVEGNLAKAYLLQSLGRSSTAIAALTVAIAMLIGVSTMVGSFRKTVDYWLRQTIHADLYVTVSSNRLSASMLATIPDDIVRIADSIPEARAVDILHRTRIGYHGRTITINGARLNIPQKDASLSFQHGNWNDVMAALDTGAIAVSEGFGLRFDKEVGDTVQFSTATGMRSLRVAGIYYDYSSDGGTAIMRRQQYSRIFNDSTVNSIALYLKNPADAEQVRATLERNFGDNLNLIVYSNNLLRNEALDVFDQTFAITYALQLVAIIVAAIGVANTLAAIVVERSRELGILKSIGGSEQQLRKMTLVQAGLIGSASQILGTAAGLALSAILIFVINRVSFGWTIQFQVSWPIIGVSGLLVLTTAILAGLGPARSAAKKQIAELVQAE